MKDFTILTATLETIGDGNCTENRMRNQELASNLYRHGFLADSVRGFYKGVDQGESFIVYNMPLETALAWAKRYGQESIITDAGLVFTTRRVLPAIGMLYGEAARATGNFTRTSGGVCFALELAADELTGA